MHDYNPVKPKPVLEKYKRRLPSVIFEIFLLLLAFFIGVVVGIRLEVSNVIKLTKEKETEVNKKEKEEERKLVTHKKEEAQSTKTQNQFKKEDLSEALQSTIPTGSLGESSEPKAKIKILETSRISQSDGWYTVQVAAFKEMERAERLIEELKGKGYSPYLASLTNSSWIFVRVGFFSTEDEAKDFSRDFKRKEGMDSIIQKAHEGPNM